MTKAALNGNLEYQHHGKVGVTGCSGAGVSPVRFRFVFSPAFIFNNMARFVFRFVPVRFFNSYVFSTTSPLCFSVRSGSFLKKRVFLSHNFSSKVIASMFSTGYGFIPSLPRLSMSGATAYSNASKRLPC
ncbi:MAG: hypothetical protein ACREIC_10740 [Limisphaerales bacterium]